MKPKTHDVSLPYDAKRCPPLGDADTQPRDSRDGIPLVDREALPTIPVRPRFDNPEAAVKMGGRSSG